MITPLHGARGRNYASGFFAVHGSLITAALALNDWDAEAILPRGYVGGGEGISGSLMGTDTGVCTTSGGCHF